MVTCAKCSSPAKAHGLCNRHYKQTRRVVKTVYDPAERLALKTARSQNGCLEWTGALSGDGYGMTTWNRKRYGVHRLAWELVKGPIPNGKVVCHRCDNPKCVDVTHLFLGTQKENIRDAWAKGRGRTPCRT